MEVIRVVDLTKSFGTVEVLKGLNFHVESGERLAIMGRSGCGKTTLLKILGLVENATKGEVYFNGKNRSNMFNDEISNLRLKEIGFIFQDFRLIESLTVEENIMLPMIIDKKKEDFMADKCKYYSKKVGIEYLLDKKPSEISGGEKQRVAICRALINDPNIIYADEPTGNLDSNTGKVIIDLLVDISVEFKKTIIIVTHDPLIASKCDRVIWLKDGLLDDEFREKDNKKLYLDIIEKMKNQ